MGNVTDYSALQWKFGSEKCFQDLILKDQNHPAALINYAALILCKHGSVVAGMLLKSLTSFWDKLY